MNILLTSAGRRVELFECIKEASLDSIVYTADTDSIAPTLLVSNKGFTVSSITDLNYVNLGEKISIQL